MNTRLTLAPKNPMRKGMQLTRVLLADDNPTARLTLQTVLEAGGYNVDSAASAAEAMQKLDSHEYALVLSDREMEMPDSGLRVLAHARTMLYRPAMALINTESDAPESPAHEESPRKPVQIALEDIPELLGQVADLIGRRANRQARREARAAC
jgi:CheY-like chemotaxis protein